MVETAHFGLKQFPNGRGPLTQNRRNSSLLSKRLFVIPRSCDCSQPWHFRFSLSRRFGGIATVIVYELLRRGASDHKRLTSTVNVRLQPGESNVLALIGGKRLGNPRKVVTDIY